MFVDKFHKCIKAREQGPFAQDQCKRPEKGPDAELARFVQYTDDRLFP